MFLKCQSFSLFPRICFSLLLASASGQAVAWGPQGHRVCGTLTWQYLSEESRSRVRALIDSESLADASTWADRMRDDPSRFWQKQAGPWHYVTVPPGKRYAVLGAPRKGDGVTALNRFRSILRNPDAPLADQQLAFRFSLHIIQDLHQPMHVGNGRDRGGNDIKLILHGKTTNLHRVWDSAILAVAGRSDARWLEQLGQISTEQARAWYEPDPEVWIGESAELRDRVYPAGRQIGEAYLQRWLPSVELRLQQAAVRGAAYFNQLFDTETGTLPNR